MPGADASGTHDCAGRTEPSRRTVIPWRIVATVEGRHSDAVANVLPGPAMPRSLTATISTAALAHNLAVVRLRAPTAKVWAVVKADAYGHGLATALQGFADADGLALIEWEGARRLREAGWHKPILLLEGVFGPDDLVTARELDLAFAVHSVEHVDWLAAMAAREAASSARARWADCWVKIDTGMSRLGLAPQAARVQAARLRALGNVRHVGWMTHFANADVAGGAAPAIDCFERTVGAEPGERMLSNSAAVFDWPTAHAAWVRPGIILYGATPFADRPAAALGLAPAMSLTGSLIAVRELAAGSAYGYGSTFRAERPTRIGIVDCGYADGYPRHAPSGTPAAVAGVRTRTLGRVSMDMLAVDLTPVPGAALGSPVELWGATVPIDEVAVAAGTIGYELMCAVAPRVRRAVTDRLLDDIAAGGTPVRPAQTASRGS